MITETTPSHRPQDRGAGPKATTLSGPVPGTRLTDAYVREVGRVAYLWGWPLVNVHNRASFTRSFRGQGGQAVCSRWHRRTT